MPAGDPLRIVAKLSASFERSDWLRNSKSGYDLGPQRDYHQPSFATDEHTAVEIGPDSVVYFHYTLRNASGDELETSRGAEPNAYLHGADNIIPGLESALSGKTAGDTFSATVVPEQAYGLHQADKTQRVPIKHLIFKGRLRPGMVVQLNTSEGRLPVTVVKAGRHSADIDTNHPLAGETLTFDIEVMEVREATPEERSHRHVHGPGGHQH